MFVSMRGEVCGTVRLAGLIRNPSAMSLNPIKGSRCFIEQDTSPSLLTLTTLWQINKIISYLIK